MTKRRVYDLSAEFLPAQSRREAVSRISALTHSKPRTINAAGHEEKALYLDLAQGLGIEIDPRHPRSKIIEALWSALGIENGSPLVNNHGQTSLDTLNELLRVATEVIVSHRHRSKTALNALEEAHSFTPARSKLEAVTRISALTNAPRETLGPGSKEHKSALINLASNLELSIDSGLNKPAYGQALATALGVPWDSSCWSYGYTITLEGLNRILAGATTHLHRSLDRLFTDAAEEGRALASVVLEEITPPWQARQVITELYNSQSPNWRQTEWMGFYFEELARTQAINMFSGAPRQVHRTEFDYSLGWVWDFKTHNRDAGKALILNDAESMRYCAESFQGLGFIILIGQASLDEDGSLRQWRQDFIQAQVPGYQPTRSRNSTQRRKLKNSFTPQSLAVIHFPTATALAEAEAQGLIREQSQGRQASGAARPTKYHLTNLPQILESNYCIFHEDVTTHR